MNDFIVLGKSWIKSVGKCILECTGVFFLLCILVAITLNVDFLAVFAKYALTFVFVVNGIGLLATFIWAAIDRDNLLYIEDDTANWGGTSTRAGRILSWILSAWMVCILIGLLYVCMVAWM